MGVNEEATLMLKQINKQLLKSTTMLVKITKIKQRGLGTIPCEESRPNMKKTMMRNPAKENK